MSKLRHWLWLSSRGSAPGMYSARLLEHFGSPSAAYFAGQEEYAQLPDLPSKVRQALLDKDLSGAEKILRDCERLGVSLLTIQDAAYPERLRQLDTAPCVLYLRGRLPQMDEEAAVAIVGARKASPYGVMAAGKLSLDLSRQGALVVSGSARGIDTAALRGALRAGRPVVSVLGNGVDVVYPAENRGLYDDIAAAGALVSEYPPGTPPLGEHFPVRNRLIAGLSLGVLVVEGSERSGSLITARWALEQNRDVFAIPGNIDNILSQGPNRLIRQGEAKLVQEAWDILSEYEALYPAKLHPRAPLPPKAERDRLTPPPRQQKTKRPKPAQPPVSQETEEKQAMVIDLTRDSEALTDDEAALLRSLQGGVTLTPDDLTERTGIPARRVLSALTMLQVRQLVLEGVGRRFYTEVILKE